MSICTNCALLAWLYDEEGKWKIEPGLAAILIMEHVLLLTKFGFSRFIPEVIVLLPIHYHSSISKMLYERLWQAMVLFSLKEPAWVRANRAKHTTQAQDMCSKKLLRTISGGVKTFREEKKLDWCLSSLLFTSLPDQHEGKKAYAGLSFCYLSYPWLNCILRRDFALIDLFIFPPLCW